MYSRSTALYDKLYHFKDYRGHADKLLAAMRTAHPGARSLLEIACGTGRFTELFRGHYRVEGLDLNSEMLELARMRLPDVPLHQGDMTQIELGRQYDIVACLFSSIACVVTTENFHKAMRSMARHVAPGGILVIEPFFTLDSYWVNRITMNLVDEPDLKIAWMYVSELVGREAHLNMHFTVGTPAGVEHFTELHRLGLFSEQEYRQAFEMVGMAFTHDKAGPAGRGLYIGSFRE